MENEVPRYQNTPFASAYPSNPTPSDPPSPDLSAPLENSDQELDHSQPTLAHISRSAPGPSESSTLGQFQESDSRRRRRSLSDSEEEVDPREIDFGYIPQQLQQVADGGRPPPPTAVGSQRTNRPAPKRRRLMTQDMRHEQPVSSNGTHRHINGSSHLPQKNGLSNGANESGSATNGISHSHTNGYTSTGSRPKPRSSNYFGHDREEVTRLLMQGLEDLGYSRAAFSLSQESGYQVESPAVAAFRKAILEGNWPEAEFLLFGGDYEPEGGGVSINVPDPRNNSGLKLVESADRHQLKFLIREQKYVELLKRNRRSSALVVLQSELQPLNHDPRRLNVLSGLMVSESLGDEAWDALLEGRHKLLREISKFISPSTMIPPHRLADLLDQVHRGQISRCLYHNPASRRPPSLFIDHMCNQSDFPLRASTELSESEGEVWFVDFSHNGKYLAACGESRAVLVYETQTFDIRHRLLDHGSHVVYVTWSPDDSKLITCCRDAKARVWDMITGRCVQIIDHHEQAVTTAAWTPDGNTIVTGSLDKHAQLCMRSADGSDPYHWPTDLRTQDCAITPDGNKMVVMSTDNYITVYNLVDRTEDYTIKVSHRMTCISVSRDSKNMLVNMANNEVHLIDIESANIVRRYTGQHQNGFIIRSAFGGADEGLVVSGSSNAKVYIWHKENGTLIETLEGHGSGCVNSVTWNSANPTMFASAGDDKKVRIWTKDTNPSSALPRRVSSQSMHRWNH